MKAQLTAMDLSTENNKQQSLQMFNSLLNKMHETIEELKDLTAEPEMNLSRIKKLFSQLSNCKNSKRLQSFS